MDEVLEELRHDAEKSGSNHFEPNDYQTVTVNRGNLRRLLQHYDDLRAVLGDCRNILKAILDTEQR